MQVYKDFSLKKFNSFGIDVSAALFSTFDSAETLIEILDYAKDHRKLMILGGGSNILFTRNFDGFVLKNEIPGIEAIREDEDFIFIRAGAGIKWHDVVMYTVNHNWGGLENLSLIPGNVGASPMQNIGAYGVEIKDVFQELEALHLESKAIHRFSNPDCHFGYRDSVFKNKFKNQYAIVNVTYRLSKKPVLNITYGSLQAELEKMEPSALTVKTVSDAVVRIRSSKLPDPAKIGNAGSFFKNPVINEEQFQHLSAKQAQSGVAVPFFKSGEKEYKIPAGWLIEQCGWKGFRKGDAGCYPKQALVLVNYGHATGGEIWKLSEEIVSSVKEKYAIALEREVNII